MKIHFKYNKGNIVESILIAKARAQYVSFYNYSDFLKIHKYNYYKISRIVFISGQYRQELIQHNINDLISTFIPINDITL